MLCWCGLQQGLCWQGKGEGKWYWLLVQVGNLLPDKGGSNWEDFTVKGKGGDGPSSL